MENTADKTIITVVGKDTVGIIAKVCTYLSENGVNVLDISQTIVSGYFNMMMIVDMNKSPDHLWIVRKISMRSVHRSVYPSSARKLRFLKKCIVFREESGND